MASVVEKYVASMVLSGVGDAMGFKNAGWEFCVDGAKIHKEMEALGGIPNLFISLPKWRVSDDTVMHLATGDALVQYGTSSDIEALYLITAANYKECMKDMYGRSAGATCSSNAYILQPQSIEGCQIPFNNWGGGCGAAMRAMCIGLRYSRPEEIDSLVSYAVESGRMTHHHPTGYLGALAAALFTAYSLQCKPVKEWGAGLMAILPKALEYIESQSRYVEQNKAAWSYFTDSWTKYLKERKILDGKSDPKFPKHYDVKIRDAFYKHLSFNGWGGASGHDAPMIAYDALLGSGDSWEELCKRGVLHGGDNDSTGVMVGAWYGAMYGFNGVPEKNYKNLEYRQRLSVIGVKLYELSHPGESVPSSILETIGLGAILETDENKSGADGPATDNTSSMEVEKTPADASLAETIGLGAILETDENKSGVDGPATDNASSMEVEKTPADASLAEDASHEPVTDSPTAEPIDEPISDVVAQDARPEGEPDHQPESEPVTQDPECKDTNATSEDIANESQSQNE